MNSEKQDNQGQQKSGRGFAGMDATRQREISSMGGKAAHESGHAHEFTSEEARIAGAKGGAASHGGRPANASTNAATNSQSADMGMAGRKDGNRDMGREGSGNTDKDLGRESGKDMGREMSGQGGQAGRSSSPPQGR